MLTKLQILQANDIKTEEVAVPEWGGSVLVRGLTGTDRDAFEFSLLNADETAESGKVVTQTGNYRAKMASKAIVDEQGKLLFTEDDIDELGEKSAAALDRICDVIRRLSGMDKGAEAKATKNSKGARKGASTSA